MFYIFKLKRTNLPRTIIHFTWSRFIMFWVIDAELSPPVMAAYIAHATFTTLHYQFHNVFTLAVSYCLFNHATLPVTHFPCHLFVSHASCQISRVTLPVSPFRVTYPVSHVPVSHRQYHIPRVTYPVSYFRWHMSRVILSESHLSCHISHITLHMPHC